MTPGSHKLPDKHQHKQYRTQHGCKREPIVPSAAGAELFAGEPHRQTSSDEGPGTKDENAEFGTLNSNYLNKVSLISFCFCSFYSKFPVPHSDLQCLVPTA